MSANQKARKISVQNRNGTQVTATSLSASTALTSSYNLTLPSSLPPVGTQALFSDPAGNLTWNSTLTNSVSTSFAGAANQTTAQAVTGLLMTTTSYATSTIFVTIAATRNQAAVFSLTSTFNTAGVYNLEFTSVGDDTGVLFSINAVTGQISYTSPVIPGFVSLTLTWLTPKTITNFLPSATNSVFVAAAPQISPSSVTGLITTTNFGVVNVFVQVSATTNLTALYTLTIYSKSGSYALQSSNIGDDTGIVFSILSATGQVQYTSPSYTGWTATTFQWSNPATLTTTPTTLASLAITGPFQVTNGAVTVGTQGATFPTSTLSATSGSLLTLPAQTVQDVGTAASGTLSAYNLAYLGIPTISALNTAVTTTTASTLTIAGAPVAGTNETIGNSYALNVQSGISQFGGNILSNGSLVAKAITGTSLALSTTLNVLGLTSLVNATALSLNLANATLSGTPSTTLGQFLNVQAQTYTDTGTAASSTAAGTFSASYLGIPTLSAANTAVTTTTASTLTIAGAPVAGTNETISNAYALNVLAGICNFNADIFVRSLTATFVPGTQVAGSSPTAYVWNPTPSTTYANTLTGFSWSADGRLFTPNSVQPLMICWSVNLGVQAELVFGQNTTDGNTAFNTAGNMLCVSATAYNSEQTVTYVWHPPSATSTIGFFFNPASSTTVSNSARNTLKFTRYH